MSEARVNAGLSIEREADANGDKWGNVGLAYVVLMGRDLMWERHSLGKKHQNLMTWSYAGGKEFQMIQGFKSEWLKGRWYRWKIGKLAWSLDSEGNCWVLFLT